MKGSSPEAMARIIQTLQKFVQVQNSVMESLKNDYQNIDDWNDKHYEELGNVIEEINSNIVKTSDRVESILPKIQLLKLILEDYINKTID